MKIAEYYYKVKVLFHFLLLFAFTLHPCKIEESKFVTNEGSGVINQGGFGIKEASSIRN